MTRLNGRRAIVPSGLANPKVSPGPEKSKYGGKPAALTDGRGTSAPTNNGCVSSTLAPLDPALVAFGDHLIAEVEKLREPNARQHFTGKAFSPEYIALACAVQRLAARCSSYVEQIFFALWDARTNCYAVANEDGVDDSEWLLRTGQPFIDAASQFIFHAGFLTPAPVPPDPPNPPAASAQAPSSRTTATVNERMAALLQMDPSRAEWSASRWAEELQNSLGRDVSKTAVIQSRAWKEQISYIRALTKEERIDRTRQSGAPRQRIASRKSQSGGN
jgi:hypothetical protein